jgi:hypothetical protein
MLEIKEISDQMIKQKQVLKYIEKAEDRRMLDVYKTEV